MTGTTPAQAVVNAAARKILDEAKRMKPRPIGPPRLYTCRDCAIERAMDRITEGDQE